MTKKTFYVSLVLLLATSAVVMLISLRKPPKVIRTNLENLPMEIMGFLAKEDSFSLGVYKELNADRHVYRHYYDGEGMQIDLYIGYYGTAKGGRTPHNPYGCLPSQGWTIIMAETERVITSYATDGVDINLLHSRNSRAEQLMLHWYQSARTKVLDSGFKQNIQRFKGKVFQNRNDGAYVQLSVVTSKEQLEDVRVVLNRFSTVILELLPEYWPEEQ